MVIQTIFAVELFGQFVNGGVGGTSPSRGYDGRAPDKKKKKMKKKTILLLYNSYANL